MQVAQISVGRSHHFHLARQLEKFGMLEAIFTGYPRFKLRDETGIPSQKIRSFPWFQAPYMVRGRLGLDRPAIEREWAWWTARSLDWYAKSHLGKTDVLIALSRFGLRAGSALQQRGGAYICDRGSAHIRYQDDILREEYRRWKLKFLGVDPRVIAREEAEYAIADRITVPSEFARRSFLEKGIAPERIEKIPYGVNVERFSPLGEPDPTRFTVLFVGGISLRKGFPDLLTAFRQLRHPAKELLAVGAISGEIRQLLPTLPTDRVQFLGNLPNAELLHYYRRAHVLVLPSIEEGFGMVMSEAMACGCPVIASDHTAAQDLITDGQEGFLVPIRNPEAIAERLERLAANPSLRSELSASALKRVRHSGGWDLYGERFVRLLGILKSQAPVSQ